MKISELIKKLQILQEKNGDNELHFAAKDYFSRYHNIDLNLNIKVGDDENFPNYWTGTFTNGNLTRLEFNVKEDAEGKHPKMTYRK